MTAPISLRPLADTTLTVNPATTTIDWTTPSAVRHGTPFEQRPVERNGQHAVVNGQTVTVPGTFTYNAGGGHKAYGRQPVAHR